MIDQTTVVAQPQLHAAAWVNEVLQPGPNGARFDTADRLLGAANLPDGIEAMYDSTSAASLPSGAFAYAGYFNGSFANMDAIRARFPGAQLVSVTPDGAKGAMYIDIEPGNVTATAVAAFIKAGGLGFYASPAAAAPYSVQDCIDACAAAGIPRSAYRVWSAHWIGRHICGPSTCGYPQADGTQYVSTAAWDESAASSPEFFTAPVPPAPDPVPVWQEWTADGKVTLAGAAMSGVGGQTAASVLAATFAKYGYQTSLGAWLNEVADGSASAVAALPSGVTLYRQVPPVPAPKPAPVPVPSPLPGWESALYAKLPAVRLGDQDTGGKTPWVRQVQLLLAANGHSVTVDGDCGPETQAGIEALQEARAALKTGWVDPVTWELLLAGQVNAVLPAVAEGSTDKSMVMRVQALCEAHGLQLAMDGDFGQSTKLAVQQVQKTYYPTNTGAQDGVVGPATWSFLAAHSLP